MRSSRISREQRIDYLICPSPARTSLKRNARFRRGRRPRARPAREARCAHRRRSATTSSTISPRCTRRSARATLSAHAPRRCDRLRGAAATAPRARARCGGARSSTRSTSGATTSQNGSVAPNRRPPRAAGTQQHDGDPTTSHAIRAAARRGARIERAAATATRTRSVREDGKRQRCDEHGSTPVGWMERCCAAAVSRV